MNFNNIKSYAKINLSLGVTGRLRTGYHKIESLVAFVNLYDEIKIKKIFNTNHKIKFFGKFSNKIKKQNTVSNLFKILDEKNLLNNQKYLVQVKKNIPQKAGLGGGSMNASAILKFFISKNILKLSSKNLINLSKKIGSDVKLGLNNKNKILYANENLFSSSRKIGLFVVIIKPDFGCSTKKIYKGVKKFSSIKLLKNKTNYFSISNIKKMQSDLEKIAFKYYPKLKKIKLFMEELPNIYFVRMTGSGSSLVGYFLSKNTAINATKLLKKKYKNYWCIQSKTI